MSHAATVNIILFNIISNMNVTTISISILYSIFHNHYYNHLIINITFIIIIIIILNLINDAVKICILSAVNDGDFIVINYIIIVS